MIIKSDKLIDLKTEKRVNKTIVVNTNIINIKQVENNILFMLPNETIIFSYGFRQQNRQKNLYISF